MLKAFLRVLKFLQIKEGDLIFVGNQFCRMPELFGPPLLFSNFESFLYQNSSSFIRFQCILYDSGVLLSGLSNLYKLKRRELISGVNQFCRMSELFGPAFCISILKVFETQFFRHSLHFNVFCMIQEYFSKSPEICTS